MELAQEVSTLFHSKQNLGKWNSLAMYNSNEMQSSVKSWLSQQAPLSQQQENLCGSN